MIKIVIFIRVFCSHKITLVLYFFLKKNRSLRPTIRLMSKLFEKRLPIFRMIVRFDSNLVHLQAY